MVEFVDALEDVLGVFQVHSKHDEKDIRKHQDVPRCGEECIDDVMGLVPNRLYNFG